jgi:hypothetical protein
MLRVNSAKRDRSKPGPPQIADEEGDPEEEAAVDAAEVIPPFGISESQEGRYLGGEEEELVHCDLDEGSGKDAQSQDDAQKADEAAAKTHESPLLGVNAEGLYQSSMLNQPPGFAGMVHAK